MKQTRKTALWILAGAVGLFLIIHYWDAAAGVLSLAVAAAVPLFIGGAIAYIVNILMSFYERHYFPKSVKPFAKASRTLCGSSRPAKSFACAEKNNSRKIAQKVW